MAVADDLPQLECGRTTEDVWAGIGRPPDVHERSCEYCQRARADLHRLQDAVDSEHRLDDDTEEPSGRVKNAIMDIARHEIRQGRRIPLEQIPLEEIPPEEIPPEQIPPEEIPQAQTAAAPASAEPELAISERALIEVVLVAADSVEAVRARRVRVTPIAGSGPLDVDAGPLNLDAGGIGSAEAPAAAIAVMVTVSVRADARIPETVAALRDRITDIVAVRVGLGVDRVDITVEDVHDD